MKTFMAFFTAVVGRTQSSSVRTIPTATSRICTGHVAAL